MNKAAQELAKLSLIARKKKYGGEEGLREEMRRLAKLPRPGRKKVIHTLPTGQV